MIFAEFVTTGPESGTVTITGGTVKYKSIKGTGKFKVKYLTAKVLVDNLTLNYEWP